MKYKINKNLILEDYMQDMMDGMDHSAAVAKHGVNIDQHLQDEHIINKTLSTQFDEPGKFLKHKYPLFDDPDHVSMRMIRNIGNSHGIDYEKAVDNSHKYLSSVGHIENDGKAHGGNGVKGSTIEGLYQTSDDQAQTAKTRFSRNFKLDAAAPYLEKHSDIQVKDMTDKQQTAMTIAGLSGHGNSTNRLQHFSRMLDGDQKAAEDMYYKDHHTKPDPATYARAERIFDNMKLKR